MNSVGVNVSYRLQGEAVVARGTELSMASFFQKATVFNANSAEPGFWEINSKGELVSRNAQAAYSGVYSQDHMSYTDYSFTIPMTGSALDANTIGCFWRYQDRYNFYFLAWDNGGGTREPSLKLFKRVGAQNSMKTYKNGVAWSPLKVHDVRVVLLGNVMTVYVDGEKLLEYTDTSSPFLKGAFGPLTSGQREARFQKVGIGDDPAPFVVSEMFQGTVPENVNDPSNSVALSSETVLGMLTPAAAAYCTANGFDPNRVTFKKITVSTETPDIAIYLDRATQAATTTDMNTYVWAHFIKALVLPAAPSGLSASLQSNNTVLWTWTDNSDNEVGFLVMDEYGRTLVSLPPGTQAWQEIDLASDTLISRQVAAVNSDGRSQPTPLVSVRTAKVPPAQPADFRGVAASTTAIMWTWTDRSGGQASYRLTDAAGFVVREIPPGTVSFIEESLTADTEYVRHLVAYSLSGEAAAVSFTAKTLAPAPDLPVPVAPTALSGEPTGDSQVEWVWEMPGDCDGFKLYDEAGTLVMVLPADARFYTEPNLYPDSTYFRVLRAFNANGESEPSGIASATTFAAGMEEEWVCRPVERPALGERLVAFQSGVGDGADLKVLRPSLRPVPERVSYDMQIQGTMVQNIRVFPKVDFTFRFLAEGTQQVGVEWSKFAGVITAYPKRPYRVEINGAADVGVDYEWTAKAECQQRSAGVWTPVTLVVPPVEASIMDIHGSPEAQRDLSTQTAEQILASTVAAYRTANGLADADFIVDRYVVVSSDPRVIVSTPEDGQGIVRGYTTAGTSYTGVHMATGSVRLQDGVVTVYDPVVTPLVLKNRLGEVYTGEARVTIINRMPLSDVALATPPEGLPVTVSTNAMRAKPFEVTATTAQAVEVEPPAIDATWTDVLYIAERTAPTGEAYDSAFAYFRSDSGTRLLIPGDMTQTLTRENLVVATPVRYESSPWSGASEWFSASVNGKEPLAVAGDGKQNFRSAISMLIPENVIERRYRVEVNAATPITADWDGTDTTDTLSDTDAITFSSDYAIEVPRESYWPGARIKGQPMLVEPGSPLTLNEWLPNPRLDSTWQALPEDGRPTNYRLAITTDNPNVQMATDIPAGFDWTPAGEQVAVTLKAEVRNAIQGAWHPRVHNGYYYFHNEEHYLYAESNVEGKLQVQDEILPVEFLYQVGMAAERQTAEVTQTFRQTAAPSEPGDTPFKSGTGAGVDWTAGLLTLPPGGQSGEYVGPTLAFDHEATWQPLDVASSTPEGTSVEVHSRAYTGNSWSEWRPHSETPPGLRLEYKLVLRGAEKEQLTPMILGADLTALATADLQNAEVVNGVVRIKDTAKRVAYVYGPVFDLGDPAQIKTMGMLTAAMTGDVTIRTVVADKAAGPWDGTGQEQVKVNLADNGDGTRTGSIVSKRFRYLRWVMEMKVGAGGTSPEVRSVTMTPQRLGIVRVAPSVHSVSGGGTAPARLEQVSHTATLRASIPGDQDWHTVSTGTLSEIMSEYLAANRIDAAGLSGATYTIACEDPRVNVEVTGEQFVQARSIDRHARLTASKTRVTVDERNYAEISPVPQQGAPLVIEDSLALTHGPLRQVHFMDDAGVPTLDCTYQTKHTGGRNLVLPYTDVDEQTLKIDVDWKGDGQWQTVLGWAPPCNNVVRLPVRLPKGTQVRVTFRMKRSYVVDYNFNPDGGTARIQFHQVAPLGGGEVRVAYETSKDTAYLTATDLDVNPLHTVLTSGFLYLTDAPAVAETVELRMNPTYLVANGYDQATVYVRALDRLGNPVPGRRVLLNSTAPLAGLRLMSSVTDHNGMVTAILTAPPLPGSVKLTAMVDGVRASLTVNAVREYPTASMSLDASHPTVSVGNPIILTARILGQSLQYETGVTVRFSTTGGLLLGLWQSEGGARHQQAPTNPNGEAGVILRIPEENSLEDGDTLIVTAEAMLPDTKQVLRESMNVKYKEG